jgi:SAM-dependent methyltransferase
VYAFDIAGSMLGILGFTIASAAGTPPVVWLTIVAALVLLLIAGTGMGLQRFAAYGGLVAMILIAGMHRHDGETWSPYYRIDTYQNGIGQIAVNVNGIPHQALHAVDGPQEPFYKQVYRWFPDRKFDDVLVVGAGTGTDSAIALAYGASHVDAVEIDREIQRIGQQHPNHPYSDPRVRAIENDGRAFLRGSDSKYDLVIFALPDSLTLVSSTANIRLESFLFTEQAFESVRDHLAPDGVFVLYNYYREPWLISKISGMLQDAFGAPPLLKLFGQNSAVLAAGPAAAALVAGPEPPPDGVDAVPDVGHPTPVPATDDWPFLYLRTPFIAGHYLAALAFGLLLALVAVAGAARAGGTTLRRFSPHFFVLGMAFLLLETRSLVSFSLLFGSTWLVNALAFFAILASVLLAILVNARLRLNRPEILYGLLFVALAVAFLLPPESLLIDPPALRYVLAAALAFTPVFIANLVFTYSFRDTRTADMAFASNLLGAMVGGTLEYVALLTGYRALLLIVGGLYALAWLFATRWRTLADVDLTLDADVAPAVEAEAATG